MPYSMLAIVYPPSDKIKLREQFLLIHGTIIYNKIIIS